MSDRHAGKETAGAASPDGSAQTQQDTHPCEQARAALWMREAMRQTPSWLVSMVFHMIVLLVLALWMMPEGVADNIGRLVMGSIHDPPYDVLPLFDPPDVIPINLSPDPVAIDEAPPETRKPSVEEPPPAMQIDEKPIEFGVATSPDSPLTTVVGGRGSDPLGRRQTSFRKKADAGATPESERAVAMALKWLAYHQMPDGGWNFNHGLCPARGGACQNPGSAQNARNAATGLVLLPFLGAGQTHSSGKYRSAVKRGLYYLATHQDRQTGALSEPEGNMYSHGIAAIALCEAYAMTHDKGLYPPAQGALNFICYAQDPVGGGWRYQPRTPGDTSVVGWQLMALKSGHMAYLRVPPATIAKASQYLDTVATNGGANYGYNQAGSGEATTAIGLLCRMYLGWKKDNPGLKRGVEWLSSHGPAKNPANMYYNYYATQVMRHWEGDEWKKWNEDVRNWLVDTQVKEGPEAGSWYANSRWGSRGGRLYYTAMATMILEVYYRHLPIYRKHSTEHEFPL